MVAPSAAAVVVRLEFFFAMTALLVRVCALGVGFFSHFFCWVCICFCKY